MKKFLKSYVVATLFIMATVAQVAAQSRRNTNDKRVRVTQTTIIKKNNPNRRISSTKVTYRTPKRKVVAIRTLPNRKVIRHNGQNYYYANNRFYTLSRGHYIVIAPKVGFRINVLPPHYKRVWFNNRTYFIVQGIFYIQINNEYEVVDPEIGTIVYELPDDYEKVTIDGLTYYEYANILYEKVQIDGTRAYEVVGIIEME